MDKNEMTLSTDINTLQEGILSADNIDDLSTIVDLFNLNIKKKDIIRTRKLSDVQDKIVEQMSERVDKRADEFSNSDLIQMHKVVQDTINKTDSSLDNVKVPTIQINQQVNVNSQEFDRESRARILDIVNQILSSDEQTIVEVENFEQSVVDQTE